MVLVKGLSKDSLIIEDNGRQNILSTEAFVNNLDTALYGQKHATGKWP